jgi:hypothetical protein
MRLSKKESRTEVQQKSQKAAFSQCLVMHWSKHESKSIFSQLKSNVSQGKNEIKVVLQQDPKLLVSCNGFPTDTGIEWVILPPVLSF